ncbi:hypothetical protein ACF0H5_015286 [Mactra antiquata]
MPATNYTWSINDKPIFEVYGTKRKVIEGDSQGETNDEEKVEKKRRCLDTSQHCDEEMIDSMDVIPDNDTLHSISHINSSQQPSMPMISMNQLPHNPNMMTMNDRVPPLPDIVMESGANSFCNNNNNNNIIYPGSMSTEHINYSQNDMIMDLNDEVYSTTQWPLNVQTDAEYEAACNMVAAMESEGAPDPYQYTNTFFSMEKSQGVETSSTLSEGQGHCTRKPSLDQYQDLRPYVSDYY